jgi:hypothetical protein
MVDHVAIKFSIDKLIIGHFRGSSTQYFMFIELCVVVQVVKMK